MRGTAVMCLWLEISEFFSPAWKFIFIHVDMHIVHIHFYQMASIFTMCAYKCEWHIFSKKKNRREKFAQKYKHILIKIYFEMLEIDYRIPKMALKFAQKITTPVKKWNENLPLNSAYLYACMLMHRYFYYPYHLKCVPMTTIAMVFPNRRKK